jgi:hypothetical protein
MTTTEDGVHYYEFEGKQYSFIFDDEIYKRYIAGVPLEDIAKARGCSVNRINQLIKRQRQEYERDTMQDTIRALNRFDQTLVRLDPTGTTAVTMAFLQPIRKFLEAL